MWSKVGAVVDAQRCPRQVGRIVPKLAGEGVYLASEFSFARVLREHGQNVHRGRANAPTKMRRFSSPTVMKGTASREHAWREIEIAG